MLIYDRKDHNDASLLRLYEALLLPRLIEERMLLLLRQGKISKWFSGIGQEGVAVGVTEALRSTDYILPLHRNLGVFTSRGVPLEQLFSQWQGGEGGFTHGRDRSFHFGTLEHRIVGMISHLGAMLGVADGIALDGNLRRDETIALVFSGDGGASEGDFHEAINVASVWDLPVIFLVENNGYGLSTPSRDQFRCAQIADRAAGYGIKGITIDGNNVLEVYDTIRDAARTMRLDKRPLLIEAMTFRMRGHEEASGTAYVPKELIEAWGGLDPIANYEEFLRSLGLLSDHRRTSLRQEWLERIDRAVETMLTEPPIVASVGRELADVYAPSPTDLAEPSSDGATSERRLIDAVSDGLRQGMRRDPELVLMGQDIAGYGGVFKVTEGFLEEFGADRVRNTPLCESAILGAALGLSVRGRASVVEMQFADFIANGFNQVVNNLAKTHYRWDLPVNVTVRMPTGAGMGAGPFHSQSDEAWFTHTPGLKVVYPSNPYDAKGLLTTSLRDPNPVLFFEHKGLYRSVRGMVPDEYYNLPFGQASVVQSGTDLTVVTWGAGVAWACAAAESIDGASIEVIDLRTLLPWDHEMVIRSVSGTGRCLVLHEDTLVGGFGAEIASVVGDECFAQLDAPVKRLGSLDTPVPFNRILEEEFLPRQRVAGAIRELLVW